PSEVRHRRLCMSLDELVKRDMAARMGRFTHLSSATCLGDHVAPHARPERHRPSTVVARPDRMERHASTPMSLHTPAPSDMGRRACRSTRPYGATCLDVHVAPHARVERHGAWSMSLHPIAWSD